jgi:hypothetical protein
MKNMNLGDRAVCLVLTLETFGTRRRLASSEFTVDADKDMIGGNKQLFRCKVLRDIKGVNREVRHYLHSRCSLPEVFKGGTYLVGVDLMPEIESRMQAYSAERKELVEKFRQTYPELKEEAKKKLKKVYRESDYPPVAAACAEFQMDWEVWELPGTPQALKKFKGDLFKKEQEKAAKKWSDAIAGVQALLRGTMNELVSHLSEKLNPESKDGKKKVLRETAVSKLEEFLSTFDARNIVDDKDLKALVEKTRKLVKGLDVESVKGDIELRKSLSGQFGAIAKTLDGMIVEGPSRKFRE